MAEHKTASTGEIHIPYNWSYADAATRTAATGFAAADVGKLARQLDTNALWMLTATTPTWVQVGGTVVTDADEVTYDNATSGLSAVNVQAAIDEIVPLLKKRTIASHDENYTLVLADAGKVMYRTNADTTARTWTIPANASVAFPVGTVVTFDNDGSSGNISIAITTDTLVLTGSGSTGTRTLAAAGQATAIKVTSTRWRISGNGLT